MPPMQEVDLLTMPEPSAEDYEWASFLWNGLARDGVWVLPGVGRYKRTGPQEITLFELHSSKPAVDELGNSVYDRHEWISTLANSIGWSMFIEIERAFDEDGAMNIPNDMIGRAYACKNHCGTIVRVEPPMPGIAFIQVNELGDCPSCNERGSFEEVIGMHVVVDDRGFQMRKIHQLEEE